MPRVLESVIVWPVKHAPGRTEDTWVSTKTEPDQQPDEAATSHDRALISRWRRGAFGPASEQPYRRRTSDWIRLVVGAVLVGLAIAHQGHAGQTEQSLFEFFNGLPDGLTSLFRALYGLGTLWALFLVVVAALFARRWRLARDLTIAGVLAWFLARFIGVVVVGDAGIPHGLDVVTRLGHATPTFPVVRLTIIVGVISAAGPYLTRPVRRLGQLLMLLMALAALYLGTGLPDAAFAALVLGWTVAAAVHLAFGSPGGRPTRWQVAAALAELGIVASDVALAPVQPPHGTVMTARDGRGDLRVRVLGRDEADAQLLAKLSRFAVYKDGGPTLHLTRLEDVEQQAYATLLAERAGVRVPSVVVAGTAGPGAALLVTRPLAGTSLDEAAGAEVTDAILDDLWDQVRNLHEAHVAHGLLNTTHAVLTVDGPAIDDFRAATGTATAPQTAKDVAELLVSTAELVGNERAIAAAQRGVGNDALVPSLSFLQPAALSRGLRPPKRRDRKDFRKEMSELRDAAAAAAGVSPPALQELHRVSGTNLMMAVGTLIAINALLSQVGSPSELWDTITSASWSWLVVALVISFATNCATAIALLGTVSVPLPLWRTSELQLSMSFSNLAVPAIGGMAAQIRFLQRQGVDLAAAVASGGLLMNAGNIVANLALLVLAVALAPTDFHTKSIPASSIVSVVLLAVLVLAIACGLLFGVPRLRRAALPPVKSAMTTMWEAVRSPRRLLLLLGGNALNAVMYAVCMQACIAAFGGSINFWTLLGLNILVSTVASLVPVPGGGTAVSSVGMSGALTAAGLSTEIAVAAVLANQLVANFLPAVPGWFATNDLLHHDYL